MTGTGKRMLVAGLTSFVVYVVVTWLLDGRPESVGGWIALITSGMFVAGGVLLALDWARRRKRARAGRGG